MANPENIIDLWDVSPLQQLKSEPLDDLFNSELQAKLPKQLWGLPTSLVSYNASKPAQLVTDSYSTSMPERMKPTLEVVGSETSVVGGTLKTSKLYAYEDFHSFLAREGGFDRERLSRIVNDVSPKPNEDFVAFLARSNGIKDDQMIDRLRQALKLESVLDFQTEITDLEVPVKIEQDPELKVGDGEDAAAFFVRAGSWQSSSAISEELASVGLDEWVDEDAESFFRRTESLSENEFEDDIL